MEGYEEMKKNARKVERLKTIRGIRKPLGIIARINGTATTKRPIKQTLLSTTVGITPGSITLHLLSVREHDFFKPMREMLPPEEWERLFTQAKHSDCVQIDNPGPGRQGLGADNILLCISKILCPLKK